MEARFLGGSRSASCLRERNGQSRLKARISAVLTVIGDRFIEVLHRLSDKLLLFGREALELRIVFDAARLGRECCGVGLRPGCEWHKQGGKEKHEHFAFHGSMLERGAAFQKSNDVRWR